MHYQVTVMADWNWDKYGDDDDDDQEDEEGGGYQRVSEKVQTNKNRVVWFQAGKTLHAWVGFTVRLVSMEWYETSLDVW